MLRGSRRIWREGSSRTSLKISSCIVVLMNHECVIMRATFTNCNHAVFVFELLNIFQKQSWYVGHGES